VIKFQAEQTIPNSAPKKGQEGRRFLVTAHKWQYLFISRRKATSKADKPEASTGKRWREND
jgi:hypothetical protein